MPMPVNRRKFIQRIGSLAGASAFSSLINPVLANTLESAIQKVAHLSAEACATDEDFWYQIRQAFTVSPGITNLNNGGVSPSPRVVQEAVEYYNRSANEIPTVNMWQILNADKKVLRRNLARLAGCSEEEIAVQRNATEALETVIFGLRLNRGDEVVAAKQDYPSMIHAWKQREHRDGIVVNWLNFEFPIEDNQQIIDQYVNAFTEKTKVVHLTHVINWTGQIMPVKEIATIARERGIEVVVDAAHSFCQFKYTIPELNCDYLGSSLHKWLCAPFGTGLLYVRKEKIKNLYPLFAALDPETETIDKFEHLGTRSIGVEQAIGQAIIFHDMIGIERKEARLRYLKNYWMEHLSDIEGLHFHTSMLPEFSCAIGMFSVEGMTPREAQRWILAKYRIHTVALDWENIHGVRVSPNVYTLQKEMDDFVKAVKHMMRELKEKKNE